MQAENGLKRFLFQLLITRGDESEDCSCRYGCGDLRYNRTYRAPLTVGEILPWALLAVLIAAVAWGISRLVRRLLRKKEEVAPVKNPDPAHIIAFRDLEKLREQKLWQKERLNSITRALRKYCGNTWRTGMAFIHLSLQLLRRSMNW